MRIVLNTTNRGFHGKHEHGDRNFFLSRSQLTYLLLTASVVRKSSVSPTMSLPDTSTNLQVQLACAATAFHVSAVALQLFPVELQGGVVPLSTVGESHA